MSAVKRQYQELTAPRFPASGHPSPDAIPPRFVFILTMNGKPLSAYSNEATAERDIALLTEGDKREGCESIYAIKLMRVDYT